MPNASDGGNRQIDARTCDVGPIQIGPRRPLTIIAGPCVLESRELGERIGTHARAICDRLGLSFIFKASFDKANRSSIRSYRGLGLDEGLAAIDAVGDALDAPTTTDLHEPSQAAPVAQAVDLLQVPAFLCRQTDLLLATADAAREHGRGINVKKGQFMAPREMGGVLRKLGEGGCDNAMLTERGTFFGYHRLVNDFIGVGDLIELSPPEGAADSRPAPVCFDVTHSTQLPGSGEQTGGRPDRAPVLARAAVAAGVHALFIECHPDPANAKSDGATVLDLDTFERVLVEAAAVRRALDKVHVGSTA